MKQPVFYALLRHLQRLLAVLAPDREGQRTQAPLRNLLAAVKTISVSRMSRGRCSGLVPLPQTILICLTSRG